MTPKHFKAILADLEQHHDHDGSRLSFVLEADCQYVGEWCFPDDDALICVEEGNGSKPVYFALARVVSVVPVKE